jgi:tetratricopeptide (TPR) repeat protein
MSSQEAQQAIQTIQSLLDIDRVAAAEKQLKEALKNFPQEIEVLGTLARLRYRQGRNEDLKDVIARMFAIDPKHTTALHYLALLLESQSKFTESLETVGALLIAYPDYAYYHAFYARLLWYLEKPDAEILVSLNKALAIDPGNLTARSLQFDIARFRKDQDGMKNVVAELQLQHPGEEFSALLLSTYIAQFKPKDLKTIQDFIALFPANEALTALYLKAKRDVELGEFMKSSFLATLADGANGPLDGFATIQKLRLLVEAGVDFRSRMMARKLVEQFEEDPSGLTDFLLEQAALFPERKGELRGLLSYCISKLKVERLNQVAILAADLEFVDLMDDILSLGAFKPTAETWQGLVPVVSKNEVLLTKVLRGIFNFDPKPQLDFADILERAVANANRDWLNGAAQGLRPRPDKSAIIMKFFDRHLPALGEDALSSLLLALEEKLDLGESLERATIFAKLLESEKTFDNSFFAGTVRGLRIAGLTFLKDDPALLKQIFMRALQLALGRPPTSHSGTYASLLNWLPVDAAFVDANVEKFRDEMKKAEDSSVNLAFYDFWEKFPAAAVPKVAAAAAAPISPVLPASLALTTAASALMNKLATIMSGAGSDKQKATGYIAAAIEFQVEIAKIQIE